MIHVCPSNELLNMFEQIPKEMKLESVAEEHVEDKPSCPLCLLAVSQIYNAIKTNKTEVPMLLIVFATTMQIYMTLM